MSKPSLRLQLTKLVFYHILLWQLGRWPQSKFHCRAAVPRLPVDEVSALRAIMRDLEFKQQPVITNTIEISNLDLTGTIHEGVGYLSNLRRLILSSNKLHGSIPDTLGNLKYLGTLDLSQNQLSGPIPASLGDLVSLRYLYLQYNLLSGGIPRNFGSLTKLTELYLQFNMLSGTIPEGFGDLSLLTTMDLSENQLSGPLPESLGKLKSLTTFLVSANYLSEKFPNTSYGNLTSLKKFSIAGNYISGPLPVETIAKWTNIYSLQFFYTACRVLMGNNFEGRVTEEIFSLQNLQYLLISDLATNHSFPLPQKIANSTNLFSLTLRNCSITGPIPKYIGEEMTSLRYLDLSFNYLTGGLPKYMKSDMIYMSFSGNMLNGPIPRWIFRASQTRMDLSFNNFSAIDSAVPSNLQLNLFACCPNSSTSLPDMMDTFGMKNTYCPRNKPKYHSLFINCGGEETTVLGNVYDQDNDTSLSYTSPKKNWAYSLSGDIGVPKSNTSDFIKSTTRGVSITEAPLYEKARLSPVSLKYYAFCLRKGTYNVTLHFHEIIYTDVADYTSLRKRAFDVYIQGNRTLNYFDIRDKEGIGEKPISVSHSTEVVHDSDLLEIHLYWPGKGSIAYQPNFNGPLISAISVNPEFDISPDKYKRLRIALITIASFIAALLLLLAFAWRMGWLSFKEEPKIKIGQEKKDDELKDKLVTVKELINATENFSDNKKIGRIGTVYKAELQGHTVAVKKLDPAQFNENIKGLNKEIGTIRSLQHNNILELLDVYIDKDLQLLVYEYMESLADILFDSSSSSTVKLDWNTRVKICLGIAKGLDHLHEHPRVKILHTNIKSANILLNENFEAKLSDFGFASFYTNEEKVKVITREVSQGYMAPEYFQTNVLTSKADVYSFGVVILEIVSGKRNILSKPSEETQVLLDRAYQALAGRNLMSLVDKSLSKYDEKEALVIMKLAVYCTTLGPSVRPTMSEVVSVLVREKTLDEVFPPAKLTGDGNVAGSTSSEKTSAASTSSNDHGKVLLD
ncbi:probable LRR receptor-like serine/threonine-protein kinase At1g07650 isoform X2 [Pyrus x bretschneideri]|uniref:probable LRR receptor-like serine/threonine-protein kinase At1g07650 isoform X2 n=1 Tax=Pyrus x bretschneideri TaxID=225117 RepID=UPI002030E044|nr:probable LRR receptor-like serine/threonine-protein kinase At1g07650 isoform X2 [Pyrus x bretschneideri]